MTWRIAITHTTGYRYAKEVTSSYNEARITPLSTYRQLVLDSSVAVTPAAIAFRYWDYWGTLVHAFDIQVPHLELAVTGNSVVETSPCPRPFDPAPGWADLADHDTRDRFAEFLAPTTLVPAGDEVAAAAEPFRREPSPTAACQGAVGWVKEHFTYEKGITDVSTPADEVLHHTSGVCQDFAHVTLALLRSMGIPARYVSGYLHPHAEAEVGTTVVGESHAWVEAWLGDWMPFDPTNGAVCERHVVVGRARDYRDLSPLHGIFHGGPAEALGVTVELTRLS